MRKLSRIGISLAVLVTLTMLSSTVIVPSYDISSETELSAKSKILVYASHAPISISGDSGFLEENASTGISWGSGIASDPYVIRGWDIDATGFLDGIFIGNSDVFFKIVDCRVRTARAWTGGGIHLMGVSNGCLDNNTCSNNVAGVRLDFSRSITVTDCNCSGNFRGIYVGSSTGGSTLSNNTISNNDHGILLGSSSENNLYDNNCTMNGVGIELLWGSNSNRMFRNNAANNSRGISMQSSCEENLLFDNTCTGNSIGIFVGASSRNTICSNNISVNAQYGVKFESFGDPLSTNGNRIWNNSFYHNNGAEETFSLLHVQAYDIGFNYWNSSGSAYNYGNYWSDWKTYNYAPYGITDYPYVIDGTGSRDYYPHAPDSDVDGIPDDWEIYLGLDPLNPDDALADSDSDGLNNLKEFWHGTNMTSSDTDSDLLPDCWEVLNGFDPLTDAEATHDEDLDGLSNLAECQNRTDPNNWDTDADGLSDGVELVFSKTDPTEADSDLDGVSDGLQFVCEGGYAAMVQILSDNWTGLQIFWSGYSISIRTNSSVLSATFDRDNKTLTVGVSGPSGTIGACRIVVPKAMIDSSSEISVFLDDQMVNFTLTQNDTYYTIDILYSHSTHELVTDFAHSSEVTPQPVTPSTETPLWLITGALAAIAAVLAAALMVRGKRKKKA